MANGPDVRMKRIYEPPSASDGYRVLIDRIWPRGVSRQRARLDAWERELAPSDRLRRWFGHDPERFEEFRRRYRAELASQRERLAALRGRAREERVTLLFGARDAEHSNACVMRELLTASRLRLPQEPPRASGSGRPPKRRSGRR